MKDTILILTHIYNKNKLYSSYIHEHAIAYVKLGYEVVVLAVSNVIPFMKYISRDRYNEVKKRVGIKYIDGIEVRYLNRISFSNFLYNSKINLNGISYYQAIKKVVKEIIKERNVVLIDAHTIKVEGYSARKLKKIYNKKTVVTAHGTDYVRSANTKNGRREIEKTSKIVDNIIFVSENLSNYNNINIPNKRVIYNGIHMCNDDKNYEKNKYSLVTVAGLIDIKNIDLIIKALKKIKEKHKEVSLDIIGDGIKRKELEDLTNELGLKDTVTFHGKLEKKEVYKQMSKSNIFVLQSINEGFGIVYAEAMYNNCITIGTKNEGIDGFIKNGKNGILIDPTVEQIENAVIDILENEKKYHEIRKNGRLSAERLTWENNAKQYVSIINGSGIVKDSNYRICKRCIMDTTDSDITFDENGYCNYCTEAINREKKEVIPFNQGGKEKYNEMIELLKREGKDKKYDCVLGISGGIDSSYLAYKLSKENLKILGVHVDAGFNTDISNKNIEILREKCNIDIKIIKINKEEMMDLQRSYFLAQVVNQDVPQDHAFFAMLFRIAKENNIHYFISGHNFGSESINPTSWIYNAYDSTNLLDIHKRYGRVKLKEYPILSFLDYKVVYPYIYKLKKLRPLNYIYYNPNKALEELKNNIGFLDYGNKHCESSFTRLFQSYIQPKKFGFEKRRAHLSSQIVSGQIKREDAIKEMEKINCNDEQIKRDIDNFITSTKITREEFDNIINNKIVRNHTDFKNDRKILKIFNNLKSILKG